MKLERTAYETEPVENITEAVHEMVSAYNRLQTALRGKTVWVDFKETLLTAIYRPVDMPNGPPISLYELGVTHTPEGPKGSNVQPGMLGVQDDKLNDALDNREAEMKFFFAHDELGLLVRLCVLLHDFRSQPRWEEPEWQEEWTVIYPLLIRLLNECRRLMAFWGEF